MRKPLFSLWLAAVGWALLGCPADDAPAEVFTTDTFDAGDDPERNAVGPGALCDRLAVIQCAAQAFCCEAPARSISTCEKRMRKGCEDTLYLDDVAEAESSGFDAQAAQQAFDAIESLASTCDPEIASKGVMLSGLRSVVLGTVNPGGKCSPPNYPLLLPSKRTGAIALASCASPETHACLPGESAWRCEPLADEGGDCFTDVNCLPGLFCDNASLALSARCRARKAPGEACEVPTECETLACAEGRCADPGDVQARYCLD